MSKQNDNNNDNKNQPKKPKSLKKSADVPAPPSPDPSGNSQQSKLFEIPNVTMRWIRVGIKATPDSYILTNRLSDTTLPGLISGIVDEVRQKPKKPSCIEEAAYRCAHICLRAQKPGVMPWELLSEHVYGVPAIAVKKAMVAAMPFCGMKGKNKMNGTFFVNGPFNGRIAMLTGDLEEPSADVIANNGRRPLDYIIDKRCRPSRTEFGEAKMADVRAVTTNSGTASASIRINLANWSAEVYIGFYDNVIGPNQIVQLLDAAGRYVGIGSNRAERSGDLIGLYRVDTVLRMTSAFDPRRYTETHYNLPE